MNELLTYDDVLITPKYSTIMSRSDVDISTGFAGIDLKIPVISANMDTITEFKMAAKMAELGGLGILHRYLPIEPLKAYVDNWIEVYEDKWLGIAVGCLANDQERIDLVCKLSNLAKIVICIDMAHGHSEHMRDTCQYIAERVSVPIIAGNVCTKQATTDLRMFGADIIKVGIGGGSACTTRIKTGCGVPQFSAVEDCANIGYSGPPIIADGGIKQPGHAAIALAAGAKAIMVGGMLAGSDCVPGWFERGSEGSTVPFRGMASASAKSSYGLNGSEYREGIETSIKRLPTGSTEAIVKDICDGIRSAMSYVGASDLTQFRQKAYVKRCSANSIAENRAHCL